LHFTGLHHFASFTQKGKERSVWREIVFYGSFSSPDHKAELSKANIMQLFKNNLQNRLQTWLSIRSNSEDWKHFLWHLLCNWQ